ncbi:purine and uridine phosphorylase [Aspergillus sclerotioniger CBS 115572]|uniref:Purine and uridine phosphorylase n=1 Tax=Aspergillus sclerotioniger CBS 115572 TaxID=1450535 RepID=A0A317WXG0_9EURO|nr:purine and uridine phosphorylase [Aspergillus sclerotioniger CBS 115572]PWY90581.1 purine and uridine phosphorylase [Aspergillus sclerotioniger CBS 115572]
MPLIRKSYTIAWISPLEVELTAAYLMLDEEHPPLAQPLGDPNHYTLGRIATHNIVIVNLPITGNTSTAAAVAHMRRTFPSVRFGVLVGIGGGVPAVTDKGRIHLGDVVVGKPDMGTPGVVEYANFQEWSDGWSSYAKCGSLLLPPAELLEGVQVVERKRARLRVDPVREHLRRIDTTIRGLRRYDFPGRSQDFLYATGYHHEVPGLSCLEAGCDLRVRCLDDSDALGDEDDGNDPIITVHTGIIGSGPKLIKDGVVRDRLAQRHGIVCFETEAAGAMHGFPCLVIRGISDYCDSRKNNVWHGYAAAVAAAYARELLCNVPGRGGRRKANVKDNAKPDINHAVPCYVLPLVVIPGQTAVSVFDNYLPGNGAWRLGLRAARRHGIPNPRNVTHGEDLRPRPPSGKPPGRKV